MSIRIQNSIKAHPLAAFFVLAFGFTWVGSLFYTLTTPAGGEDLPSLRSLPGALVWYYGPCLAALIVTAATAGKEGLRGLLKRLVLGRVGWVWYAFIVLYPLVLHGVVSCLGWLLGGPAPRFFQAEGVPQGNILLVLAGLFVSQMLLRGIGEETGWRGYALPMMLKRHNAFTASLVLGVLWAAWHFHPANFSALLSLGGVFIFLEIVSATVIFTWIYLHTRGSILIAMLFHTMSNLMDYVIPIGMSEAAPAAHLIQIAVTWVVIGVLLRREGMEAGRAGLCSTWYMA